MTPERRWTLALDPAAPLAGRPALRRAIDRMRNGLRSKGIDLLEIDPDKSADAPTILVAGADTPTAQSVLRRADVAVPDEPDSLALVRTRGNGHGLLASGADERGVAYAVLEVLDRIELMTEPLGAIDLKEPVIERPSNKVRSVARLFASEVDDKPWFHDKDFWRRYLPMLMSQRFNRINLMVGLGYNFPWQVTDGYLLFAYPFLVNPRGHSVRVPQLPTEERERNLAMLQFISSEAVANGLDFQLGFWTHAYEWFESPNARHTVEGLTDETHATYCRDALRELLDACPAVGGLTFRIHGESGIPERTWDFWRVVLEGVVTTGRRVGIDLHAKGLDQETLNIALATGLPVTVSPKYSAEHMGLAYHQTALREMDRPPSSREDAAGKDRYMSVSEGSRPFTRYSYADFLREDRDFDVVFRIWPGTQRLLMWGDPEMAAAFGRSASMAGSQGLEWCEPLSLKGRQGSGLPGSRDGYADPSLSAADDWGKYAYSFRLMGRLCYNPDTPSDVWGRFLRAQFRDSATNAEVALAAASRILPLVTTAHHPSASNNYYWPEIYTDMPIVVRKETPEPHYYDTPIPKRFGNVSPLDPELFSTVEQLVDEAASRNPSGRYSPLEVAGWLDRLVDDAESHRARLKAGLGDSNAPEARRLLVDVAIEESIGRFFAGKLRAAVWYELSVFTGSSIPLPRAVECMRAARNAWAVAVDVAAGVYVDDLTFGPEPYLRGTWADRLPAIDIDLSKLSAAAEKFPDRDKVSAREVQGLIDDLETVPYPLSVTHRPPHPFRRGEAVEISVEVVADFPQPAVAMLRYRPLDQSRKFRTLEMSRAGDRFVAQISGHDLEWPYPLQYFFVLRDTEGAARLHPGLGPNLTNQPYYVVRALTSDDYH